MSMPMRRRGTSSSSSPSSRLPCSSSSLLGVLLFLSPGREWWAPGGGGRGRGAASLLARAAVPCDSAATCERIFRPGSTCEKGECTNPFASGCLRRLVADDDSGTSGGGVGVGVDFLDKHGDLFRPTGGVPGLRVCNSDDPPGAAMAGMCAAPTTFDYDEIRIAPGNWESSMFGAWISQILLSEVLRVPTTIETGKGAGGCSFYDLHNNFSYPTKVYNWEAVHKAHQIVDCRETDEECAHAMPEVWAGQKKKWKEAQEEGYAEAPDGNDMIGRTGWYVPKFTIDKDPSVGSVVGLRGKENQKKLAKLFKRPATWQQYCDDISLTGCAERDDVAERAPNDEDEGGMYYKEGLYIGHFRYTEKNNCTLNPDTCTGLMVEPTCKYSSFTQSQIHWNDMYLESGEGTLPPQGAFSWAHQVQLWYAANATKSDILFEWWTPDWLPQVFDGTDGAFHRVTLEKPTQECARNRVNNEDRCSADHSVRVGKPEGSCDYEANVLKKVIAASLKPSTYRVPVASRSGAYDLVKSMSVSDLAISQILQEWRDRGVDTWGYDPREVVCSWVADNLDELRRHIPDGYPRVVSRDSQYKKPYLVAARVLGSLATAAVVMTATVVWQFRKRRVMQYAQVNFLGLILFGFFLVSIAAITYAAEPSTVSCVTRHWLTMLGFTFGMVPLVVKVHALNKIMRGSRKMKKVQVDQRKLYATVGFVVLLVTAYLAAWTAVDPPSPRVENLLDGENGYVVRLSRECASDQPAWHIAAMCWQIILLVCATVLAFQARNVRQEFNESKSLAIMDYSHFMFAIFRAIVFFMTGSTPPDVVACAISFLLSFDSLFALSIYFGPKVMMATRKPSSMARGASTTTGGISLNFSGRSSLPSESSRPGAPPILLGRAAAASGGAAACRYCGHSQTSAFASGGQATTGNGGVASSRYDSSARDPTSRNCSIESRSDSSDTSRGSRELPLKSEEELADGVVAPSGNAPHRRKVLFRDDAVGEDGDDSVEVCHVGASARNAPA